MAALSLHHTIFANETDSNLSLRPATFLHPVAEKDGSPTSELTTSAAYQDLIQRQPTHPDGPSSGWDLGLNLLGDPMTAFEHKSEQDSQTRVKLRRLRAINVVFEVAFGMWGTYATVRYSLAFANGLGDPERVCALVLGITSALAVALVITSILMPLVPQQKYSRFGRYTRSLLRMCYLLLLFVGSVVNFVLVLVWHPSQRCNWDIDISWYTSSMNTVTSPCHTASSAAWITGAALRLVVTLMAVCSYIYTLRSYYRTRHPNSDRNSPKYSPYLPSDLEDVSPVLTPSPLHHSKSTFGWTRSEDSNRTLNQSNATLPKYNSISTLAPSTSCTGHSRTLSSPPPKDVSPPRISPPTSRRASSHAMLSGFETPSETQPVSAVIPLPLSAAHMLRRTSRISITQVASEKMLSDTSSHSERPDGPTVVLDPSEIRPAASWKPGHRGSGVHLGARETTLSWEDMHVGHMSSTHEDGKETEKGDDVCMYSYGYGATEPVYPYLDTYNSPRAGSYASTSSSCEDVDKHGPTPGRRRSVPGGPALPEVCSEPRSSPSMEESSGEEEEYVAMMGGFVRRMATIESLGSREAAGTLVTTTTTTTTGSAGLSPARSKTPVSQFSSVRFAEHASSVVGVGSLSSIGDGSGLGSGSVSTAYLSFSSGGTGMRVNERGELAPGSSRSATGSPLDRHYFTATSGGGSGSFPRTDGGEGR